MADPYAVLGVPLDVDDAVLRKRYLELVRLHPPERSPEQFAAIREAYDRVRDPIKRVKRRVFAVCEPDTLDDVCAVLRERVRGQRIPTNKLLTLAEE